MILVERTWKERTLEKLKLVLIMSPFFIVSFWLVVVVGGEAGLLGGITLLLCSSFIAFPVIAMTVNQDYYKEVEDKNGV